LIHDLIKPRKFNCVSAVSRGISSALPRRAAEFTKLSAEFVKFCHGKLWALVRCFLLPSLQTVVGDHSDCYAVTWNCDPPVTRHRKYHYTNASHELW